MLKKINRILKLVGFNLVRAKRKKTLIERRNNEAEVPLSDYMGETEWQNTPPVAVPTPDPDWDSGKVPGAIGDSGHTHFVGDDCPGGHRDLVGPVGIAGATGSCPREPGPGGPDGHGLGYAENGERNTVVGYEAKMFVVNPNAAFVPVDIGADNHEITRTEHESKR